MSPADVRELSAHFDQFTTLTHFPEFDNAKFTKLAGGIYDPSSSTRQIVPYEDLTEDDESSLHC